MKRRKGFTLDWYKELGWRANPFEDKVLKPISYFITGYAEERQKLNYFIIEKQPFGTIAGDKGMGKTALLQWVMGEMKRYKSRTRALYIKGSDLTRKHFLDILCRSAMGTSEHVAFRGWYALRLHKAASWLKNKLKMEEKEDDFYKYIHHKNYQDLMKVKMFLHTKLQERGVLFLIDDVGGLPDNTMELMKELYAAEVQLQVILAGTPEEIKTCGGRHFGQKDTLKIKLSPLNYAEVRDLLKKRIKAVGGEDIWPVDDIALSELWKKAEESPQGLLKVCYDWTVKQALKGLRAPKKRRKEKEIVFDQGAAFDMPSEVMEADSAGELHHKDLLHMKEKPEVKTSDYNIKVKDHGGEAIVMDFDTKNSSKYKIKEVKKKKR
ncbi:MAG: AAA family ATPase [Candidatus Nanoarchaeia archaeon]